MQTELTKLEAIGNICTEMKIYKMENRREPFHPHKSLLLCSGGLAAF